MTQDDDLAAALEAAASEDALAMASELRSGKLMPIRVKMPRDLKGGHLAQSWVDYLPGEPAAANVPPHLARQVPQLVEKLRAFEDVGIELLGFKSGADDPGYMVFREIEGRRVVFCLRLRRRVGEQLNGA